MSIADKITQLDTNIKKLKSYIPKNKSESQSIDNVIPLSWEQKIFGNVSQIVGTGKNLLKDTDVNDGDDNYWYQFTTFDKETRTLTKKNATTTESFIFHRVNGLKSNTQYTLSLEAKSNGLVSSVDLFCFNTSTQGIKNKNFIPTTEFQKYVFTFTTDSNIDYSTSQIRIDNNGSKTAGQEAILTIRNVMLAEGTETNYEPHGITPTPTNPSEVKTMKSSNILPIDLTSMTLNGITATKGEDDFITIKGTATATTIIPLTQKTFTFPSKLYLQYENDFATTSAQIGFNNLNTSIGSLTFSQLNRIYDMSSQLANKTCTYVYIYVANGTTLNGKFRPMIHDKSTIQKYIPYGYIQEKIIGNNLLRIDIGEIKNNGITYTPVYANKELLYININGTATNTSVFTMKYNFQTTINNKISGCFGGSATTYKLDFRKTDGGQFYPCYDGEEKILPDNTIGEIRAVVYKDITMNNVKIYPMISTEKGTYEPYQEKIINIDTKGNEALTDDYYYINENGDTILHKEWNKKVLDDTDNWQQGSNNQFFLSGDGVNYKKYSDGGKCICTHYPYIEPNTMNTIWVGNGSFLIIADNRFTTRDQFKNWLSQNKPEVWYRLATPIEINLGKNKIIPLEGQNNIEILSSTEPTKIETTYYEDKR